MGEFFDYDRGISLGCPLSPLIGAIFLGDLDRRMARLGLFYVRFMDDVLVLAPTRWKLRRAVRAVNGVLGALGLEKHPDKTFIGRVERGFDFLGYHFGPDGLTMAARTIEQFVERALRLYEQEPGELGGSSRLGLYVRRWARWAEAGLQEGTNVSRSYLDPASQILNRVACYTRVAFAQMRDTPTKTRSD